MIEAERLLERVSTATGISTPNLRAVWLREASADSDGGIFDRCKDRVVEFATRGPQSRDADLWPAPVSPVTAASQLLIWENVPTAATGHELLELGARVWLDDDGARACGVLVKSTVDSVTVNINGRLVTCSPSDVACMA